MIGGYCFLGVVFGLKLLIRLMFGKNLSSKFGSRLLDGAFGGY
jgi:hypothetical protein